jgi:pentatricopeptide repeat protein
MQSAGIVPNVVTYTSLIKGYCEVGRINSAYELLTCMLTGKHPEGSHSSFHPPSPNVRTVNAFLRGCERTGYVTQAFTVFELASSQSSRNTNNSSGSSSPPPDVMIDETSFEYCIFMLCQSLRKIDALKLIHFFINTFATPGSTTLKQSQSIIGTYSELTSAIDAEHVLLSPLLLSPPSTDEIAPDACPAAAAIFLSLARLYTFLLDITTAASLCHLSSQFLHVSKSTSVRLAMQRKREEDVGNQPTNKHQLSDGRHSHGRDPTTRLQTSSISLFIQHRLSELQREIEAMVGFCQAPTPCSREMVIQIYSRFLPLFNIPLLQSKITDTVITGTTQMNVSSSVGGAEQYRDELLVSLFSHMSNSFGLNTIGKKRDVRSIMNRIMSAVKVCPLLKDASSAHGVTSSGCYLDFAALCYEDRMMLDGDIVGKKRKGVEGVDNDAADTVSISPATSPLVNLEICSGTGEWLIGQAIESHRMRASRDEIWACLEIRSDRVYQSLSQSLVRRAPPNTIVIGGDAERICQDLILPSSVSTIFVNHPEPPERRSGGEDHSQGSHLLSGIKSYLYFRICMAIYIMCFIPPSLGYKVISILQNMYGNLYYVF